MNFAIVSDLHAHVLREHASSFLMGGQTRSWKLDPVLTLLDLAQRPHISADVLLCPGDLTDQCDATGIESAARSVRQIASALGVIHTLTTIGNHDIDSRHLHGAEPFAPIQKDGALVPSSDPAAAQEYWTEGFTMRIQGAAAILVVNSGFDHKSPQEAKRGAISTATLERIEVRLAGIPAHVHIRIALVHHHPHLHEDLGLGTEDVMVNGSLLLSLLEEARFELVIHGHKHHPKLSYAAGGSASPAVLAAGSLAAIPKPVLASNVRNLFHIVSLGDDDLPFCTGCGMVRSWEFNAGRGWRPSTAQSAGFPHRAGFGCRLPPKDLAAQIRNYIGSSRRSWQEVISALPHVEFALPQNLRTCFLVLRSELGVKVRYDDLGEPMELAI